MDVNIQHAQIVMGLALVSAAAGTLVFALLSRWLGGVWITLIALAAAGILVYPTIVGGPVFIHLKTDILRRILVGLLPFAGLQILLSLKRVSWIVRLFFSLIGPAIFLAWVFNNAHGHVSMQDYLLHQITPIALVVLVCWICIEPLAIRSPGIAAPFLIASLTAGIAVLLLISIEKMVLDAVVPATAAGAALAGIVAAKFKWKITFARGPVLFWLTAAAGFFAFMWFDAETLYKPYLLWISAAIPLAWVPQIPPLHRLKPWKRELLRCILILIPITIGSGLAYHTADQAGEMDGINWPVPQSTAPRCPSQIPIPNTINPPTIT